MTLKEILNFGDGLLMGAIVMLCFTIAVANLIAFYLGVCETHIVEDRLLKRKANKNVLHISRK